MGHKKAFTLLFILIFFISEMKPLLPYLGYYLNFNYISTELCIEKDIIESNCKGHCYLEEKIKEPQNQSEESTTTSIETENILLYIQTQSSTSRLFTQAFNTINDSRDVQNYTKNIYSKPLVPPPEV